LRPPDHNGAPSASLGRRALALAYEALLLAAWLLAGAVPFVVLTQGMGSGLGRPLFQFYLVAIAGAYFIWQWRLGHTLAMKTWRLRLVTREGAPLSLRHAAMRFLFALAGTLLLGAGFLWALVDRERLFLHDRLAGTRIIMNDE
jgi:uncharacterized RDD family membrane protein YckC